MAKTHNRRNSFLIISSNVTSKLGNKVFDYANQMMISQLFPKTPFFMGLYQSVDQVVRILFNLFAGAFADRHKRKKMLMLTDFLSGIVCVVGLFFLKSTYIYIALLIGNMLLALLSSFNSPLYNAIVKDSISSDYVETHMSRYAACKESMSVISPTIGLVIWHFFGIHFAYIFNAVTFFASAFISFNIIVKEEKTMQVKDKKHVFHQIMEGIVYIWKNKIIRNLLIVSSLVNLFLSLYNLMLPYLTHYYSKQTDNFYGKALITESIGAIVFSLINSKLSKKNTGNNEKKLIRNLFLCGASILIFPIVDLLGYVYIDLLPFLCIGGFLTLFNVQFFTTVQKETDTAFIGRVYSVIFTIAILFMPVGSLLFSLLISVQNLTAMLIAGIGIILTTLCFIFLKHKQKSVEK